MNWKSEERRSAGKSWWQQFVEVAAKRITTLSGSISPSTTSIFDARILLDDGCRKPKHEKAVGSDSVGLVVFYNWLHIVGTRFLEQCSSSNFSSHVLQSPKMEVKVICL